MKNNVFFNFILNFLQLFMQICVAVSAVNFILHGFMGYETFQTFNTLYIGVVVIAYYLVKTFIGNGRLALILHLAAAMSVLFVVEGALEDKVLVFVPAIVLMYYSLHRSKEAPVILLDVGILLACYLLGFTIGAESATTVPFYGTLIYIIAYMIWYNISNLNKLVSENASVKSFNAEQSISVNSVMMTVFILICVIVMAVIPYLRLEGIMWGFLNILWKLLLGLLSIFKIKLPQNSSDIETKIIEHTNASAAQGPLAGIDMEMSQGTVILNVAAGLFAAVILVFMLVILFKAVLSFKYYKSTGADVKEFIKPVLSKDAAEIVNRTGVFDTVKGNDRKIRRIYYKLIKSRTKKNGKISRTASPQEISRDKLGWDENAQEITHIYEKARYSDEEIAAEEVAIMKNKTKMSKF